MEVVVLSKEDFKIFVEENCMYLLFPKTEEVSYELNEYVFTPYNYQDTNTCIIPEEYQGKRVLFLNSILYVEE